MLVGIMGKMGAGKTLIQSILANYLYHQTGAKIYANYGLKNSIHIDKMSQVWKAENGIICIDEAWLSMDARLWKDNVKITQWINQTRKKKLLVFYTTQHIRQIELRMRTGTDILIYCEKKPAGHWISFIDWQYGELGRRFLIDKPERYYNLYDTFEVVSPIKMD